MSQSIRVRLSAMMFIQYLGMGVVMPMMGHYLKGYLAFTPLQVGVVLAMPAVAALFGPFFVAQVADRWISAERLLAVCHFFAAAAMILVWSQTEFRFFLFAYLLYWLLFTPTMAMTNTIAFHHLTDARRDFGPVRMWGTIGWVVVGFLFGILWLHGGAAITGTSRLPDALLVSAGTSIIMGCYALSLPVLPMERSANQRVSPWRSLSVFLKPSLAVLCAATFLTALFNQFYVSWMSPYLSQYGIPDGWILPMLSIGQLSEIAVMGQLGRFLERLGIKRTLLLGLAMQVARFAVFALGPSTPLLVGAIALHGFTFACFFATAFIYVDNHCTREQRAGAQQVYGTVSFGFGNLSGSLTAGAFAQCFAIGGTRLIDYQAFWLAPLVMAITVLGLTAALFREEPGTSTA